MFYKCTYCVFTLYGRKAAMIRETRYETQNATLSIARHRAVNSKVSPSSMYEINIKIANALLHVYSYLVTCALVEPLKRSTPLNHPPIPYFPIQNSFQNMVYFPAITQLLASTLVFLF